MYLGSVGINITHPAMCSLPSVCTHAVPHTGQELLLSQSYAKNMGLYGERVGALSVVCGW
jgi:hypothetical protein